MDSQTMIEEVRAFWDERPCNLRHSAAPLGSARYFAEVRRRKHFIEPHIRQFAQYQRWVGKKVLEIGCGIGTDTVGFARWGADVTAVDLSPVTLDLARQHVKAFGLGVEERVTFYEADAEALSQTVPVETYDLVYSFGVLHHTPSPSSALLEIQKYMDDDTILKIMLYHRYTPKVLGILLHHWRPGMSIDDTVGKASEAQSGCPVTYTFTKASARKLLQDFEILDMHVDHIFLYRVADYIRYRYVVNWWWRWMPRQWFHLLERHFGWHLLITAKRKELNV